MIELNADIGEGGADVLLLAYVNRVSIACGGHVGDTNSMRTALSLAGQYGLKAGAHPSYPDPANFGRKVVQASSGQIADWLEQQTRNLMIEAESLGIALFHVKPHGALYNRAAVDIEAASGVIAAVKKLGLALVALAGSPLVGWAREAGVVVFEEAFADRRYLQSGQLAPRTMEGAVIDAPTEVLEQALAIAQGKPIQCLDGGSLRLRADTLCLHGEQEGAAARVRAVAQALGKG